MEKPYTQKLPYVTFSKKNTEILLAHMEKIQDNYTTNIRHFCRFVREKNLNLSLETIKEYFIQLNTSDYTANTINTKRHAVIKRLRDISLTLNLDNFVKMEAAIKLLNKNIQTKPPKPPVRVITKDKIITPEEYNNLMAGARSDRQQMFIKFLYLTGCRISELTGILIRDVHHTGTSQGTVKIRIMGKGAKERFISLPVVVYKAIEKTFALTMGKYSKKTVKTPSTPLFCTSSGKIYSRQYISNQIKKLGNDILGKNISAHTLRHSFATNMIAKTGKIKAVSRYLGHSTAAITLNMYVHQELSAEELFE